jgi:OOP family OmpA-OmpF porin
MNMQTGYARRCTILGAVVVAALALSPAAFADDHIKGVITDHGKGTLAVQTADAQVVVVMNDATKIRRTDGIRELNVSSSTLISGLRVEVSGEFAQGGRFVAEKVSYSRSDLKTAQAIQAGITTTDQRSLSNQAKIEAGARILAEQQATLDRQAQQLAANKAMIAANDQKIVATSGRISDLDDYNAIATVTVYFANGSAMIDKKYMPGLQELASKAKASHGYMVQVQGYTSTPGTPAYNTKLSMQRADAVAAVLQQSGVPPTTIVVPAAMGETQQVASDKTKLGQAENRRTVVTLLQNKGIGAEQHR